MKPPSQAAWLFVGRLSGDALAFGLFVLIARAFGPAGAGAYFFTFAIATIFYELVSLGIEEYGVREYARAPRAELLGRLAGAQLTLGLAAALLVLLAGRVSAGIDLPLLAFMLVYQLAFALARTLFIPAFVRGRVSLQVLAETATRTAVLASAVVMIAAQEEHASLTASLLGLPIFGGLLVVAALLCARRFGGPVSLVLSRRALGPALRSIWPFAAANVVSGVYTRSPVLVLYLAAGGVESGLFASAWKFAELSWALLILVPWAGYAALARLIQRSQAEFRTLARQLLSLTLVCGGLFAWGTYWIIPPFIGIVLGAEFAGSTMIVQLLAAFVALAAANELLERIALVAGLQIARLKIMAGQAALNLILILILVPPLGTAGAALALIVSQAATVPALLFVVRPFTPASDLVRPLAVYALALGGAACVAALPLHDAQLAWTGAAASLIAFGAIAHAGGLLQLARAGGAWRSEQAWGR